MLEFINIDIGRREDGPLPEITDKVVNGGEGARRAWCGVRVRGLQSTPFNFILVGQG